MQDDISRHRLAGQEVRGDDESLKGDTYENERVVARYQITSIPTVLLFKDGEAKGSIVGAAASSTYSKRLERVTPD